MGGWWPIRVFAAGRVFLGLLMALCLAPVLSLAGEDPVLRVEAPLVLIPVHLTTSLGNNVAGLDRTAFQLFEDGVEQKITHFFVEDAPVSVGLLLDVSGSMRKKIHRSAEAVAAFFKAANPEDEFFLVEFNDRARLTVPFTTEPEDVQQRMRHAGTYGRTSLFDALQLGLMEMKRAHYTRKAILVLSDGGENRSRFTEGETRSALREAGVELYAMGIFEGEERPATHEERQGPYLLTELTADTGGQLFTVGNLNRLPEYCARIGAGLRSQYVLGYSPANRLADGRYHKVRVALVPRQGMPPVTAHHRAGYYAPVR
ncbi:MAG TPA: VWA domain-containing protein [Bryobacteraceae bacterium]|jgi:Ca-activated chloride channel family protein|nr:VWA domain-containing protein [Bryobacteraceae bacterium]